jgi:hypothetical protein
MAGTIVADTIQNGAGNSTSMDNAIYGSAKAWASFTGSTAVIRASYNVSSVVRNSTGNYTINFTNALSDANYSILATSGLSSGSNLAGLNTATAPTSSAVVISSTNSASGAYTDSTYMNVAIFR